MPIPFRDAEDVEALGAAGFLRIQPTVSGSGYVGALFLMNARGEPLEFAYNRVETPETVLWRRADLRRHAERRLVASLLTVSGRVPRLLLCLAEETDSELFCQDIHVDVPVGRLGEAIKSVAYAAVEVEEVVEAPERLHLFWFPAPPGAGTVERRLLDQLLAHGLLREPFARAEEGLREVYGGDALVG